jgi:hypothetical protein
MTWGEMLSGVSNESTEHQAVTLERFRRLEVVGLVEPVPGLDAVNTKEEYRYAALNKLLFAYEVLTAAPLDDELRRRYGHNALRRRWCARALRSVQPTKSTTRGLDAYLEEKETNLLGLVPPAGARAGVCT